MTIIPWQAKAVAGLIAAGAIFAGGWTVASWRASGQLEAEKLKDQQDVAKLQSDWAANIEEANKIAAQARADLDVERTMNAQEKADAEENYEKDLAKRDAANARLAADAGRVRDELAAAQSTARTAAAGGSVQQAGIPSRCSGADGDAACGFLARALDLAKRCADVAGRNHAALVEAIKSWPEH
jgi:hypothetical protein